MDWEEVSMMDFLTEKYAGKKVVFRDYRKKNKGFYYHGEISHVVSPALFAILYKNRLLMLPMCDVKFIEDVLEGD